MSDPRARAPWMLLIGWALLVLLAPPASGQSARPYEGQEIKQIDIDAPPATDLRRIREALHLQEGDLYRTDAVDAAIAALKAMHEFTGIDVETLAQEGGVRVVFHLRAWSRVRAIRFEGQLSQDEEKLLERLQTRVGSPASPYAFHSDRNSLRAFYLDEGYPFVDIRQDTRTVPDGVEVVYHIESGPRVHLETLRFEGQGEIPEKELRKAMIAVKEGDLFGRGKFDPALLPADLDAVRDLIRRRGYLDATVGHEVILDESKERAYLVIRVRLGPLYHVQHLTLRGAEVYDAADLLAVMKLAEGAPFSQDQLRDDLAAIKKLYGRKGYIHAEVEVERTFGEKEPLVALTLLVHEGAPYHVNRVLIRGNRITEDHVVRRDVTLLPGELANTDELDESKRRLTNSGLFFNREPGATEEPIRLRFLDTREPGQADLLVEVVEGGRGNFMIGGSVSSTLGFAGNLRLVHYNFDILRLPRGWRDLVSGDAFSGGGQTLTLSLTPGNLYNDYRLAWSNPSVWDSPYSVGFDLYYHELSWSDYFDDRRIGGSVSVGRRVLKDRLQIRLTPRVEQIDIRHIADDAPADARDAKGYHLRDSLALSATYDVRDNVWAPSRGHRLAFTLEDAGSFLGGDVNWLREEFEARKWWTVWDQPNWGKHVVNVGANVGFLQSTDGDRVPIFDRYFIGGLGTLRGFRYRRVGPVDAVTNRQVGGEFMAVANAEYEFPIVRDYLRGVFFLDSGTLERSVRWPSDFRVAAGTGLRLRVPALGMDRFPFSIYLGVPVVKADHDKTEALSFTFGTGFQF